MIRYVGFSGGGFFNIMIPPVVILSVLSLIALYIAAWFDPEEIPAVILVTFFILSMVLPFVAILGLRRVVGKSPIIPGESILVEYIKAKKAKICPFIEYEG